MKTFESQKKAYLEALYKPDKSKKGSVDVKISPLIDLINSKDKYVSTSSCSGRTTLLWKGEGAKKHTAEWPYATHNMAEADKVWEKLVEVAADETKKVWFKMESCILHIMCKDIESAQKLVNAAKAVGLKYSGIFVTKVDRVMVEIMSCEKIETLVAIKGKNLVDEEYINIVTEEANQKLRRCHKLIDKLYNLVEEF